MSIEIRPIEAYDREWLREFLLAHNHSLRVVSRGVLHQADSLPGFIAELEGVPAALLTYRLADGQMEVVSLHAALPGRGLGSALLARARAQALELGCSRLWLITINTMETGNSGERFHHLDPDAARCRSRLHSSSNIDPICPPELRQSPADGAAQKPFYGSRITHSWAARQMIELL